jgi:hypothetical protein
MDAKSPLALVTSADGTLASSSHGGSLLLSPETMHQCRLCAGEVVMVSVFVFEGS